MYLRLSRTWLLTTLSTMSFIPCRSTHPHRSCITIRICLTKQVSQKFRTAWKESARSDRIFWTKAAVAFDENGAAKNILTAWKDLNDKGFAPIVGKGGDAGLADFSAGKAAITLGSTASLKQILQDVNGKFEVGTAYFPKIKSSDEGGVSIGGASLWALNNNDPKKLRATWEFVKFLISPESQAYWNAQTGYFPVTVKAQDEQVFKDNVAKYPQFQTAIDQLHDSSADYVGALLSVFPEARATVESEIESMLNGKEDVDTAVKNMADSINKSIEEYNLVNE